MPSRRADDDHAACAEAIRRGSKSFHAASRLLPARVRDPALALYAFCRSADDSVDIGGGKAAAVAALRGRLGLVYAGRPEARHEDRAFAEVVAHFRLPRALPEALIEGLAWDAAGRRYETMADLIAYAARVAGAVGAMMAVLMGSCSPAQVARACDLGVAMQLTNIARDVCEDAANGRIYLPLSWLREAGIDPEAFLADPRPTPALRRLVARLLDEADRLYGCADGGIAALPAACRPAIFAARLIYAAIGREIARAGHDSVSHRAATGRGRKLALLAKGFAHAALPAIRRGADAPALPECAFLVEAARFCPGPPRQPGAFERVIDLFTELEWRDRERDHAISGG